MSDRLREIEERFGSYEGMRMWRTAVTPHDVSWLLSELASARAQAEQLRDAAAKVLNSDPAVIEEMARQAADHEPLKNDPHYALAALIAAVPAARNPECHYDRFSSRVCEQGRKGCNVRHAAPAVSADTRQDNA